MKTTAARRAALEKWIVARHPYDTPEVVALPIAHGHRRYLDWVRDAVQ